MLRVCRDFGSGPEMSVVVVAEEKSVCVGDGLWQEVGRLAFTSAGKETGFVSGFTLIK